MATPVLIKQGNYRCQIHDINNFTSMPILNLRRLWTLMFRNDYCNEDTIQDIQNWLPSAIRTSEERLQEAAKDLADAQNVADTVSRQIAAYGSIMLDINRPDVKALKLKNKEALKEVRLAKKILGAAKSKHSRLLKLQDTFTQLHEKYLA